MISGTYVLTDTIDKAFSSIFADSYAGTDVVVSGKEASFSADFEKPPPPPVDASLLDEIRAVDSVELAMGGVYDEFNTKIVGDDGKALEHERRAELRVRDRHRRRSSPSSTRSTCSRGAGPRATARSSSTRAPPIARTSSSGESIAISTLQPKQDFEVVGIAKYGDVEVARQRDLRDLRRRDRPGALRPRGRSSTRSRSPARTGRRPRSSSRTSARSCPPTPR